jgi:hypothetical protein
MYTGVICAHLLGLTVGNNLINLVVFVRACADANSSITILESPGVTFHIKQCNNDN